MTDQNVPQNALKCKLAIYVIIKYINNVYIFKYQLDIYFFQKNSPSILSIFLRLDQSDQRALKFLKIQIMKRQESRLINFAFCRKKRL